jgi:hypothetical protein
MPLPRSVGIRRAAVPAVLGAAFLLFAAACSSSGSNSTAAGVGGGGGTGATPSAKECSNIPAGPISPHLVGWGNLAIFGVTESQVPAGTVDSCDYRFTTGQPTSTLLTPTILGMLKAEAAKIGINSQTSGVIGEYLQFQALAHAIETSNSLNGPKMAAALDSTSSLPTVVPGLNLSFTATPAVHNGYPLSSFTECTMQTGPYDIRYAAS